MQSAENGFKKHHLIPFKKKQKTKHSESIAKAIQDPTGPNEFTYKHR